MSVFEILGQIVSQSLQTLNKEVVAMSILIALAQNVIVDMLKSGVHTNFTKTGANLEGSVSKIYNNLILLLTGVIVYTVTYFTGDTSIKDSIIGACCTTVLAYAFYRAGFYDLIVQAITAAKTLVINYLKSKFSK